MGLQLSSGRTAPYTPWDAAAAGVTGVRFTVENPPVAGGVRAIISVVSDIEHGFVYQGDTAIIAAGEISGQFAGDFVQPSWGIQTLVWDPTQVHALQFQGVTHSDYTQPYEFCISNIQFIDATGTVVDVPPRTDGAAGAGSAN
jgi:hypothetical protein